MMRIYRSALYWAPVVVLGLVAVLHSRPAHGDQAQSGSVATAPARWSVRDVGEYAAVPWQDPDEPIQLGSRADRVRDLNFSVASVNLHDDMSEGFLRGWAQHARRGKAQGKKFLPRLYFWDGTDRFTGPVRDIEVYWKRLDTFLADMNLQDFEGIVLAEENVDYGSRPAVLRELYARIKAKYAVDVWQWWSPMRAVPSSGGWIPADGWVIDPYMMGQSAFRRYLRKYYLSGVPVVAMVYAETSPNAKPLSPGQWQANRAQLETAIEFNVPVAFYWVYGTGTQFGGSRAAPQTELDRINHWVWNHIERVRQLPEDYSGLPSADVGFGNPLEIGPTQEDRLVYSDSFSDEKCVDDASMTGFRDLVLDGSALFARGYLGRDVNASLQYHFVGDLTARFPEVSLDAITDAAQGGRIEVALSPDGRDWSVSTFSQADGQQHLQCESRADDRFSEIREFFVRIRMTGEAGSRQMPPVRIDNLKIDAVVDRPEQALVQLKALEQQPGVLVYEDAFESQKYKFHASITNDQHLEWSRGQIGVRMRPGGSRAVLVWKVTAESPVERIRVDVAGKANGRSLGTHHFLDISTDGQQWLHEANTLGKEGDVNGWISHGLQVDTGDDPRFQKVKTFFVRLRMKAQSYKEKHPHLSGLINQVRIAADVAPNE